jgi:exodeoxyribonuclease VII large subunit
VTVQGDTAADEIREAIVDINSQVDTDIIVLCRGGGSIEDLWAFNDEQLAGTIHGSAIPVVSAVGHEIDFTIADFAADLRAPTPSAAAEMLLPDSSILADRIAELARRLHQTMQSRLDRYQDQLAMYRQQLGSATQPLDTLMLRLDHLAGNMEHAMQDLLTTRQVRLNELDNRLQQNNPLQVLLLFQHDILGLERRLQQAGKRVLRENEQTLARAAGLLDAVSPLSTLARGYAIARKQSGRNRKTIITAADQVCNGEKIEIILHKGRLDCSVLSTTEQSD